MVRLKNELTAKEEENMEVTAKMTQASTELATVSGLVSELQEVQKGLKVSRDEAQRKVRQLNKDVEAANKKMATLEAELKVRMLHAV
jgi:peptidoglycan hydrolase CwlO-like protein